MENPGSYGKPLDKNDQAYYDLLCMMKAKNFNNTYHDAQYEQCTNREHLFTGQGRVT